MDEERTVFQPRSAAGGIRAGVRLNETFEIEHLIAQGGMGEVYKGFNIQTHDPVAIKMIRPEMSGNPDVLALFRREAGTLFKLYHEGIVRYFGFSVDPALERAYLAMEFVDGPSLAKRISERPLTGEEARIFVTRIGSALDAAHRLGVIHRDISSDNVILPDGDVRKAKLIDFGIARAHRPGEATIIGDGFAGKYNYVSPEQLGLAGGAVTAKSDIYSFGLVLAEALRGRPLDMSGTQVEIVEKRRRVPDLTSVPAEFRPLLQSLLQPDPANRPSTMAAVIDKLSAPAAKARSGAATPLLAAALIAVSLGAVGYVFRDDIGGVFHKGVVTPSPSPSPTATTSLDKPPPLPEPSADATPQPSPQVIPTPPPSTTVSPGPTNTSVPNADVLSDAAPPRAPLDTIALPPATVGAVYRAALPAFADPGGKGLKLTADGTPDGLVFADRGDGSGEFSGTPARVGNAKISVEATNRNGRKARMSATITVGAAAPNRPPEPTMASVTLSGAIAGRDYNAKLPPFDAGSDIRSLALRAEPIPPEGLTFADAGGGLSLLSGRPAKAGDFKFDVVSSDSHGEGGRMTVMLTVAPAPDVASPSSDKLKQFLGRYEGGLCFFAGESGVAGPRAGVVAAALDTSAFTRLKAALERDVGGDLVIATHPLSAPQCAVADALKLPPGSTAAALQLDNEKVGAGRPLAGRIQGLGGRRLALISIDDDGDAFRLPIKTEPDGASATFNESLNVSLSTSSLGKTQILLAIVADRATPALDAFKSGSARELLKAMRADWPAAGAAASVGYYELTP